MGIYGFCNVFSEQTVENDTIIRQFAENSVGKILQTHSFPYINTIINTMHEMGIACDLVDLVQENLPSTDTKVEKVGVRLGVMAGVVKDALLFCFDAVAANTQLEGSELIVEEIPLTGFCATCNTDKELPSITSLQCPDCTTYISQVSGGQEIQLDYIEVAK